MPNIKLYFGKNFNARYSFFKKTGPGNQFKVTPKYHVKK